MGHAMLEWEAVYSTGKRSRIGAPDVTSAIANAWDRAPDDAQGLDLFGLTHCALSGRPTDVVAIEHLGIIT